MVRKLADDDHEQEDAADCEHREDDLLALFGSRHGSEERVKDGTDHGEKLPHTPLGVRGECGVDGSVARGGPRRHVERRRVRVQAKRGERPVEHAPAE